MSDAFERNDRQIYFCYGSVEIIGTKCFGQACPAGIKWYGVAMEMCKKILGAFWIGSILFMKKYLTLMDSERSVNHGFITVYLFHERY